jgi:glucose-1-phosphate thymidylyltransferase
MKLIIPMAGMGKRMRPHTLSVPKPLISIAGVPIVERLVEEIAGLVSEKLDEIGFIVGHFGQDVENRLLAIAQRFNSVGKIYYQEEALGTAHAIYCAEASLSGKIIVAFADTLFKAKMDIREELDSVIFVKKVDNPESFGVVQLNDNLISGFFEKPKQFVSDLAIIGIYYFKDGLNLRSELKYLLDNNIKGNNEYQLTDALENMKQKGLKFGVGEIEEWLDCGNKDATVYTNQRILHHLNGQVLVHPSVSLQNAIVIQPSFVGEGAVLQNCIVGPYASIGESCKIISSVVENSIIQDSTIIENAVLKNSMVGNFAGIKLNYLDLSVGDYNIIS